jgi:MFS family permease
MRAVLQKNILFLLSMVVLLGLGEKMAERFLPLYLVALGGGALSVGLLNGMDNLLSALYSFPGGYLSDRLGYKRALMVFNLLAMLGFLVVIVFPVWQAVIIGSIFFISWTAISLPATMSMISQTLPGNRHTMGVSLHSLVRRVPMALGPLLGGVLITQFGEVTGTRWAFGAAFVLGAAALVFQGRMVDDGANRPLRPDGNLLRAVRGIPPALRRLLVSDILIRFCEQIPYAFAVLWVVDVVGVSPAGFGVLTAIEMVTAILIYIPVAVLADRSGKRPFVLVTFGFFAVFPLILLFSRSFSMLIVAFIVRGLKEFGEPARKALILELCPPESKAGTFGAYYLVRDVVVSVGAFGGAFLWQISPAVNFLAALGGGVVAVGGSGGFGRDPGQVVRRLPGIS